MKSGDTFHHFPLFSQASLSVSVTINQQKNKSYRKKIRRKKRGYFFYSKKDFLWLEKAFFTQLVGSEPVKLFFMVKYQ